MDKGTRETMSQLDNIPVTVNSFTMKSIMNHYEVMLDDHKMNEQIIQEIDKQGDKHDHKTNVKADMTDWDMRNKPGFKEIQFVKSKLEILDEKKLLNSIL